MTKEDKPHKKSPCYAHSIPGRQPCEWQTLEDHLKNVAETAARFAESFQSSNWAWNAGWIHDIGKADERFQAYLLRENGLDDSEYDESGWRRVNHSSAGAALAEESFKEPNCPIGRTLAYLGAGHHAGLADWYEADTGGAALRIRLQEGHLNLNRIRACSEQLAHSLRPITRPAFVTRESYHLWVRMLYSCLVDSDYLDTEAFLQPGLHACRSKFSTLGELKSAFDAYMAQMTSDSPKTPVNAIRQEILAACRAKASQTPGLFSLNVPTGGGKTLSATAFALEHAVRHRKKRIIYVIPYTSIIEQTAATLASIFGAHNVVEHHSNLEPNQETQRSRLAAENWDAPVIVTTNVQFFESLFSHKSSRCRKLHNIVNSVVILDEAQLLPPELISPCVHVMNRLVEDYGVTMVISTATQPALPGLNQPSKIISDPGSLHERLKRTKISFPASLHQPMQWMELAEELRQHDQVLCIVNTRKHCHDLFKLMPKGTIHLSALMCGQHRSKVIQTIKEQLAAGQTTRVVSTQLVEAGVDMDFSVVYRALAGLDSIAQSAGRCNREGHLNQQGLLGEVHVFVPPQQSPQGVLLKGENITREMHQMPGFNPHDLRIYERYFELFYSALNDTGETVLKNLTPSASVLDVAFRTVGENFRLIEDNQRTLFVHYDETSESLIRQLHFGGPTGDLLRRLQRYTVNLPEWLFQRLQRDIVEEWTGYWVWNGRYDEDYGVDVFGDGLSPEATII
ncbi:MAG: CRISPR-associated helicase Cas3' [Acidobacteriota bacterium]|mgnify:CR=1 FL=1|nr:CRISPR-associated helicase Cas3' [Acidobacteriota bacterium]